MLKLTDVCFGARNVDVGIELCQGIWTACLASALTFSVPIHAAALMMKLLNSRQGLRVALLLLRT